MKWGKTIPDSSVLLKKLFFILLIHLILFAGIPLVSVVIAFEEFSFTKGIFSPFNGLNNFRSLLGTPGIDQVLLNTITEGISRVVLLFGYALTLALILHRNFRTWLGKTLLFITLLPQFVSWVSTAAMMKLIFSNNGILYKLLGSIPGFFSEELPFKTLLFFSILWHDGGLLALIILLALLAIDSSYYDAARLETKSEVILFHHITWPFIKESLIIVLALLFFGFFSGMFEPLFNMANPALRETTDTLDTLLYRIAFSDGDLGKAYTLEFIKNIVNVIIVSILLKKLLKYSFKDQTKISGVINSRNPTPLINFVSIVISLVYIFIFLISISYAIKGFPGIIGNTSYFKSIFRTLLIALVGGIFCALMNSLVGYSLTLNNQKTAKRVLKMLVWFGIVNGGYLGLSYAVRITGLKNNFMVLFIPYMFNFLYMFMTYSRIRSHAGDMIEALMLDGADDWRILVERLFKMDRKHFLTLWLLYIIFIWNNWLPGVLFISTAGKEPLQSFIRALLVDFSKIPSVGLTTAYVGLNERAAYIMLSIFPVLILGTVIINLMKRR